MGRAPLSQFGPPGGLVEEEVGRARLRGTAEPHGRGSGFLGDLGDSLLHSAANVGACVKRAVVNSTPLWHVSGWQLQRKDPAFAPL